MFERFSITTPLVSVERDLAELVTVGAVGVKLPYLYRQTMEYEKAPRYGQKVPLVSTAFDDKTYSIRFANDVMW